MKHNHFTRDIKEFGECPACDEYHKKSGKPTPREVRIFDMMVLTDELHKVPKICPEKLVKARIKKQITDKLVEMNEKIFELDKMGFAMSAELSYKDRLIKAYEEEIDEKTQLSIKNFIFSEDDR